MRETRKRIDQEKRSSNDSRRVENENGTKLCQNYYDKLHFVLQLIMVITAYISPQASPDFEK